MMWKTKIYARASALPAIAAALALSSTPAWSQEVQPTAEPDPIVIDPPAPVLDSAPVTTGAAAETETATEAAPASKPKPKARSTASAGKAAATRVASAAPAAAAPAPAPEAALPASQPIVEARPKAQQPAPAPEQASAKPALPVDEDALMLGGGALALLALGGGAIAMTRRRRGEEEEIVKTPVTDENMAAEPAPLPRHDPVHEEQPAIVVPSAFAWGEPQQADRNVEKREGETWVERAYRGPTPDNPSLSLRKRLKRANFFDARERRVAAGKAKPIPTDAGLPENVEVRSINSERELELA